MIIIQNPSSGQKIDSGAIILWWGNAASLPAGWSVYSAASGKFVRGATTPNLTPSGTFTHHHSNESVDSVASHGHSYAQLTAFNSAGGNDDIWNSGSWDTIKSHTHGVNVNSQTSASGHGHGMDDTNDATVYPPFKRLYWIQCTGQQDIPIGGIIMFSLAYASRPSGFNLCNGGSYSGYATPDLRGRFIYAAASDSDVGNIGGSEDHVHNQPNTDPGGTHKHSISGDTSGYSGTNGVAYQVPEGAKAAVPRVHSHTWSSETNDDPNHVHSVPDTGSGSSLPAYVKLYFLMRTE